MSIFPGSVQFSARHGYSDFSFSRTSGGSGCSLTVLLARVVIGPCHAYSYKMNKHSELLKMGMGDQEGSETNLLNLFMDINKTVKNEEEMQNKEDKEVDINDSAVEVKDLEVEGRDGTVENEELDIESRILPGARFGGGYGQNMVGQNMMGQNMVGQNMMGQNMAGGMGRFGQGLQTSGMRRQMGGYGQGGGMGGGMRNQVNLGTMNGVSGMRQGMAGQGFMGQGQNGQGMVGQGGLRRQGGMLGQNQMFGGSIDRNGFASQNNLAATHNLDAQLGDDTGDAEYEDEYLEDYSYSTADAAVDATNSKYDLGQPGQNMIGNRRMGIGVSGNRGYGMYGSNMVGQRNGYGNMGVSSPRSFGSTGASGFGGTGSGYGTSASGGGAAYGRRQLGRGNGISGYGGAGGAGAGGYGGGYGGGGMGGGGYGRGGFAPGGFMPGGGGQVNRQLSGPGGIDNQLVLLRPPPNNRNQGSLGSITDLIDIDYETLVLLLGVAGAGASWALYQTILTKGRRSFGLNSLLKKSEDIDDLDKVADFVNIGMPLLFKHILINSPG